MRQRKFWLDLCAYVFRSLIRPWVCLHCSVSVGTILFYFNCFQRAMIFTPDSFLVFFFFFFRLELTTVRVIASYPYPYGFGVIHLFLPSFSYLINVHQGAARYKVCHSLEPETRTARRVQPFTLQMRKLCFHFLSCAACVQGPGSGISCFLSALGLITLK